VPIDVNSFSFLALVRRWKAHSTLPALIGLVFV
jgi:hypothetical protein